MNSGIRTEINLVTGLANSPAWGFSSFWMILAFWTHEHTIPPMQFAYPFGNQPLTRPGGQQNWLRWWYYLNQWCTAVREKMRLAKCTILSEAWHFRKVGDGTLTWGLPAWRWEDFRRISIVVHLRLESVLFLTLFSFQKLLMSCIRAGVGCKQDTPNQCEIRWEAMQFKAMQRNVH